MVKSGDKPVGRPSSPETVRFNALSSGESVSPASGQSDSYLGQPITPGLPLRSVWLFVLVAPAFGGHGSSA